MKFKSLLFLFLLAGALSACSGQAPVSNWPGLTVQGDSAYLADGLQVHAVRLADGSHLTVPGGDPASPEPLRYPLTIDNSLSFFAPPVFNASGDVFYVGNMNSHGKLAIHAFNTATGADTLIAPESKLGDLTIKGAWMAPPLLLENRLYAPNADGNLYLINLADGSGKVILPSEHGLWSSPVTDGKSVYVSALDHFIYSIQPQTGALTWKTDLGNALLAPPAIAETNLYVGTLAGTLYAIDALNGNTVWSVPLGDSIWSTPVVDGDFIYVGVVKGSTGMFYAINRADGKTAWEHPEETPIIASPVVAANMVVYVSEGGRVQALDKTTGNAVNMWQANIKGNLYTTPVLAGDKILVAPFKSDFLLVAYDLNGAQKWTYSQK